MGNSIRRNTAFDLTKPEFVKPQNRLDANRWLAYATFGAGTPETDLSASTKTTIVPLADTQDDAAVLMDIGYEAYVDAQLNEPVESKRDMMYGTNLIDNDTWNPNGVSLDPWGGNHNNFLVFADVGRFTNMKHWWADSIHGKFQIKQKLAYALSQIFVADETDRNAGWVMSYHDILMKATENNNTSTYLQLLEDVTYHPLMGAMLTYVGNLKFNPSTNARPDENYAREILQLFSIGLTHLNMDGTPKLNEDGNVQETYTPEDITALASVFTGFDVTTEQTPPPNRQHYMVTGNSTTAAHELGDKALFPYLGEETVIIPATSSEKFCLSVKPMNDGFTVLTVTADSFTVAAGTDRFKGRSSYQAEYSLSPDMTNKVYCLYNSTADSTLVTVNRTAHGLNVGDTIYSYSTYQWSLKLALNHIFNHPNVPPFMAKSLIRFFTTSNPSPAYVERVANVFVDNGNGVRGDLAQVVKAILLDREAVIPYGIDQTSHGKYQTVVDRLVRVGRAFKDDMVHVNAKMLPGSGVLLAPTNSIWPFYVYPRMFTKPTTRFNSAACATITKSLQPMQSHSVFNFFRPGFVPPTTVMGDIGKVAPEVQLNTVGEQISWMHMVSAMVETTEVTGTRAYYATGNRTLAHGLNFGSDTGTATVTSIQTYERFGVSCDLKQAILAGYGTLDPLGRVSLGLRRLTDNYLLELEVTINGPIPVGTITFVGMSAYKNTTLSSVQVGDVFEIEPLNVYPVSGLSYQNSDKLHSMNFTLYKVANTLPEQATQSSDSELNTTIDYMASRVMTRPISQALRDNMLAAGRLPTTEVPKKYGSEFDSLYNNFHMSHSQIKVRRMLGLLLVSPEFSVLT